MLQKYRDKTEFVAKTQLSFSIQAELNKTITYIYLKQAILNIEIRMPTLTNNLV